MHKRGSRICTQLKQYRILLFYTILTYKLEYSRYTWRECLLTYLNDFLGTFMVLKGDGFLLEDKIKQNKTKNHAMLELQYRKAFRTNSSTSYRKAKKWTVLQLRNVSIQR